MFFSCTLILVAAEIVQITEGEVAGIGFKPTAVYGLVLLLACLTAATLVVFWLGAAADYRIRYHKRLSMVARIDQMNSTLLAISQAETDRVPRPGGPS